MGRIALGLALGAIGFVLVACTPARVTTVSRDDDTFRVTCIESDSQCIADARETCPRGFHAISGERHRASERDDGPGSVLNYSMTFVCDGSAAFAPPAFIEGPDFLAPRRVAMGRGNIGDPCISDAQCLAAQLVCIREPRSEVGTCVSFSAPPLPSNWSAIRTGAPGAP